jgi:RNA polymerase sigma factor (sigma-70 family)
MAKRAAEAVIQVVRSAANATGAGLSDRDLLRRFGEGNDQAAFAAVVRRHAGMVLGVCRRALRNAQDAEDACQATFLVLAQKAKRTRWQPSIANWLYTTARKVARNARLAAQRRSRRESRAAVPVAVHPVDRMSGRELLAALDEELDRLPPRYREPLVLCYLEGLTRDETATRLDIPAATLKTRLERGRKRLGDALTRRGCALGAGLLVLAATSPAGASPPRVVQAVLAAVAGPAPAAAALAKGVAVNGRTTKTVLLILALMGTAGLGTGVGLAPLTVAGQQTHKEMAAKSAAPPSAPELKRPVADDKDTIAYSGRVLGPDGKPVAGAKVYLAQRWRYPVLELFASPVSATTGADGGFAFTARRAKPQDEAPNVVASAPNLGVGWVELSDDTRRTDLTVQLVADDVPITGQIVDLEGRPVPGARLRVLEVQASPQEDLGTWQEAAKDKSAPVSNRNFDLEHKYLPRCTTAPVQATTTDAAGRFRLTGIGRERVAVVLVEGPDLVSERLHIRTRPGEAVKVPSIEADPEYGTPKIDVTYYGPGFRHVAAPTRPIVGVVRDKDTKQPLAGVTIRSYKLANNPIHLMEGQELVRTTTDAQGRYRLVGMPKGAGNKLMVVPPRDLPYVAPAVDVPDTFGPDPVTVDVELKRAVWIEGRITDKATGKPVRENLIYLVRDGNPNLRDYPGFHGGMPGVATNEDGTYRIIGLPGPGQIVVFQHLRPEQQPQYLLGAERDDEDGLKEEFHYIPQGNFAAFARIDPRQGAESVRRDIVLVPGWTFTGTVLGPDGKPFTGVQSFGLSRAENEGTMKSAEFTVRQFNPRRPRPVFFRHAETGLVGLAHTPQENGGSVTVRMEPGAAVTGRLVDAQGMPRPGVELRLSFRPKGEPNWNEDGLPEPIMTDREGRFRIDALPSGFDFWLFDGKLHASARLRGTLNPGQTTDLGDVRIKR